MEALILYRDTERWNHLEKHTLFDLSKILDLETTDEESILDSISGKDVKPNRVVNQLINEYSSNAFSVICIDAESLNIDFSILLACHLRFSNLETYLKELPIIVAVRNVGNLYKDHRLKELKGIQGFQYTPGFEFLELNDFSEKEEDEEGNEAYSFEIFIKEHWGQSKFKAEKLDYLKVTSEHSGQDRHSIANQWGAIRLARNAGYTESDINYEFPATLHFKYLNAIHDHKTASKEFREHILEDIYSSDKVSNSVKWTKGPKAHELIDTDGRIDLSPLLKKKKILLIDDNADKGWKETLQLIFKADMTVWESHSDFIKNIHDSDISEYDFLLVDLYLPERRGDNELNKAITYEVIEYFKNNYPHIPLIVFTASNKSWTLDEVLELGADGMYVKESPEFAGEEEYTKENFKQFCANVIEVLISYRIIRPYTKALQRTINSAGFMDTPEKDGTKIKERIEERLWMFIGLLVQGNNQRNYYKERFYFSDYELAFMTLWSCFNEISELNFEKSQPECEAYDEQKKTYISLQPDNKTPLSYLNIDNGPKHYKWKLRDSEVEVFIEYNYSLLYKNGQVQKIGKDYKLKGQQVSPFILDLDKNEFRMTRPDSDLNRTKVNYEKTLYMQIAFIIQRKKILSMYSWKKQLYQNRLLKLNDIRNHLYLTHADDIAKGFFNHTVKEKREIASSMNPAHDIKDLFELVAFLLSGEEFTVGLTD